jgi:serine/threonine-protein kinase
VAGHPQSIGKYKVTRPLGKGAMGMVYEGFDPVIERKVAIKTILGEYLEAAEMEEAVARFKREAQAGGRLMHPGIVGVYEYGHEGEMAFIVMEYVEGDELKRTLATGKRFELIEVFEIMKQLLGALDYSHKQGVVHRDIKPANLMILPGPKVKIMDFGIARLATSNLTQVGTVVGTPTHMAPEQLMGVPADGRADLWSSGVILYELLTAKSPFMADTPAAVMHKVLQGVVAPPRASNPRSPRVRRRDRARPGEEARRALPERREFQGGLLLALQGKAVSLTAARRMPAPDRTLSPADAMKVESSRAATAVRKAPALSDPGRGGRGSGALALALRRAAGGRAGEAHPGEAASVEDFFRLLADNIPEGPEQDEFLKKMKAIRPDKAAATPATPPEVPGRGRHPLGLHPRGAGGGGEVPRELRGPPRARAHQGRGGEIGQPQGTLRAARRSQSIRRKSGASSSPRSAGSCGRWSSSRCASTSGSGPPASSRPAPSRWKP